jgi:hypothetical protein
MLKQRQLERGATFGSLMMAMDLDNQGLVEWALVGQTVYFQPVFDSLCLLQF